MILLSLLPAVFAGSVYINGVRADLLPEITITNATVRFDAAGNVWVDAPGYRVQVVSPSEYDATTSTAPSAPTGASSASSSLPPAPADGQRVPPGQWWLVTEDNDSTGHAVEVIVNGTMVRRVNSGDPQVILDIGPWLHPGSNTILMSPLVGPPPGGGMLNLYVGRGSNLQGTIHLDNPDVKYGRRATDTGGTGARQFTLTVP